MSFPQKPPASVYQSRSMVRGVQRLSKSVSKMLSIFLGRRELNKEYVIYSMPASTGYIYTSW